MKHFALALSISLSMLGFAFAQTADEINATNATRTVPGASARDGFTLRGTETVMTRNGITTKLEREVTLPNGMRVLPNGNVTMPNGTSTALRGNQLLSFDGTFQDVVLTPQGVAPLSSVATGPAPKTDLNSTVADGFSISGKDVWVTRHGVREKVTGEVRLPNGVVVKPSGIIVMSTGNTVTLRPDQMLDLNGILRDVPVKASGGR